MGLLNSHVYNSKPYNGLQSSAVLTVVELVTSLPKQPGLFNAVTYNSIPYNGSTTGLSIAGTSNLSVVLSKIIKIPIGAESALGLFNSKPYNSILYNGAMSKFIEGHGNMSVVFGASVYALQAGMHGTVYIGGQTVTEGYQAGGYNTVSYGTAPYEYASNDFVSIPSLIRLDILSNNKIKMWNGTDFVQMPIRVWNGTTWTTYPIRVWNGTNWVLN